MASTLRAKLLAQTKRKSVTITPAFLDGVPVRLPVMSVGERRDLITATTNDEGERDAAHFEAMVVIACAYDAKGEKLLSDGDRDALVELPSSVLDELAAPALQINGLLIGGVETARKNSNATPSDSTSTDSPNVSA
jgi:hypothetical protein